MDASHTFYDINLLLSLCELAIIVLKVAPGTFV
jgi:hypothetical protein